MGYPKNYIGIQVSRQTHQRLKDLKENPDVTFDSVVNKLLDLEEKYATEAESYEYEYLTEHTSKLFRITFDEKVTIAYYNSVSNSFEKDIMAWQSVDALSEDELNSFVRFIVKDSSLYLLYDMDSELVINDVMIKRVLETFK